MPHPFLIWSTWTPSAHNLGWWSRTWSWQEGSWRAPKATSCETYPNQTSLVYPTLLWRSLSRVLVASSRTRMVVILISISTRCTQSVRCWSPRKIGKNKYWNSRPWISSPYLIYYPAKSRRTAQEVVDQKYPAHPSLSSFRPLESSQKTSGHRLCLAVGSKP